MEDVMSYPTLANMPEIRSRFAYERDRLTTRVIQPGVTPDTLIEFRMSTVLIFLHRMRATVFALNWFAPLQYVRLLLTICVCRC